MAERQDAGDCGAKGDSQQPLLKGSTIASYFWDDGSGVNGDTGSPASGEPMQKGLAASPSWPMGTKGYVVYKGKKADFFIGDRGPGIPSNKGVMLDLDGKTFADLTGGNWDSSSLTVEGAGGMGHIPVEYVVTEWGPGPGKKGAPMPFSSGAYRTKNDSSQTAPSASPCPVAAQESTTLGFSTVSASGPQTEQDMPLPVVSAALVVGALAVTATKMVVRRAATARAVNRPNA